MLRITLLALAITLLAPPASAQSRCSSDGLGGYRCQDTQTGSTTTYRIQETNHGNPFPEAAVHSRRP